MNLLKKNYDLNDLINCWKKLKIKKGDTVYVTGNFLFLGLYYDSKNLLRDFLKTLKNSLGSRGTIAFPTHSWSLVQSRKFFSIKNTPSESGVFTEYLRKKKNTYRQFHPFSSTSAIGYHAKYITNSLSKHVYGLNSPFDKLINLNAKFISIGLEPNLTCSQVHHAELMSNVPYRFVKEFTKLVERNNKVSSEKYYLYVLYNSLRNVERDRNKKILSSFNKKNKIIISALGKSKIYCYSLREFYKHTLTLMEKDIYIWLKKKPKKRSWA